MNKETDDLIQEYVARGGDFRDWRPRYNIASTDTVPVIRLHDGQREIAVARWGIVPALGFYEWQATAEGKQPYFIRRPEGDLAMAGIIRPWLDRSKPEHDPERWRLRMLELTSLEVAGELGYSAVSKAVNSVRNDGPELITPISG